MTGRPRVEWRFESNFKTATVEFPPKTALMLAQEKKYSDIITLLTQAGGGAAVTAQVQ
ncbi:MAG: hypothetical protein WDO12_07755 [Pseudomonadota bacterium]